MVAVELSQSQIECLTNLLTGATVPMSMAEDALATLKTLKEAKE